MKLLRTLIVDDEPLALNLLRAKLAKQPSVEIVAEGKNGREALQKISELEPDLVFLDIEMPGLNGFDVITNLQNDLVPMVIFTTAYEQYALNAFDVHAVDYILKPIDEERITRAVERAIERRDSGEESSAKKDIIGAMSAMGDKKIVIKERDEIILLKQEHIEWIDAAGDYCCLHAEGETHIKRTTLKDLLEELDPEVFKRVHRSTIVNLNFIDKVIPHTKGEYFLLIGEFERLKVSRNYRDVIKHFLDG